MHPAVESHQALAWLAQASGFTETLASSLLTSPYGNTMQQLDNAKIAIIGLGYVGLPLAVEFGKQFDTVGFDIRAARVDELCAGRDSTLEVDSDELSTATRLRYSAELEDIRGCN